MSQPTAAQSSVSIAPADPADCTQPAQAVPPSPSGKRRSPASPFPVPERSGAAFDPARLDALITRGDWIATPDGPLPVAAPLGDTPADAIAMQPAPMEWIAHERAVLAGVLAGKDDHSPRWGLFRRRIGLRYDEAVPARLWSTAELRLVAAEIDAIFRGQRDVRMINAEALRQDARSRLADGRYRGSFQQLEVALAELLDSAQRCSALDFPIAKWPAPDQASCAFPSKLARVRAETLSSTEVKDGKPSRANTSQKRVTICYSC